VNNDNLIVRARLKSTDDSGDHQSIIASGRAREQFGGQQQGVMRVQVFGFSSHAPANSHGLVLMLGGNPDQAVALGMEHPESRPKDLAEGEAIVYNQRGDKLHLQADGVALLTCSEFRVIAEKVVVECPDINLGGEGGQPVALLGSVDNSGDIIVGNVSTTVKAV